MNILPKFLYLFQAVPIGIPTQYFKRTVALFTRFIWAHKTPRIIRSLLTLPKQYGGLAISDLYKYYQAAHLGRLIDWCRHGDTKIWPCLEQAQSSVLLNGAPWCFRGLPINVKTHPLIGPILRQCSWIFSEGKLSPLDSPLFPILVNPQFSPGRERRELRWINETGDLLGFSFYIIRNGLRLKCWPLE